MSETPQPLRVGRSIAAVLAGLLTALVLSIGTDVALHTAGIFPRLGEPMRDSLLLLAAAYRAIYCVVSAYIAARLAPDRPMEHALALGITGFVVSTVGAVVTWNHVPSLGPHWYPLALIVTALPCAWLGGALYRRTK